MIDIRVCFSKTGTLKYISHLDLQRAIHRMLNRSGLPIWFSEGFNPHPKLNIALPLSIYQEGEREVFDFRLTEHVPNEEIVEKLRAVTFPEMEILSASVAEKKPLTKRAAWRLEMITDIETDEFIKAFSGEMSVVKRTKTGEKTIDIAPMVKLISAEKEDNKLIAKLELPAAGNDYLNPSYVASFFGDRVKLVRTVRENIIF